MEQDRIKHLKRAIEMVYKKYTQKANKKTSLMDLARFFNIPIDESRLEDYEIKSINYNDNITMELIDKRKNTLYDSEYYIFSKNQDDPIYIKVTEINPSNRLVNLYYLGYDKPIRTKLKFTDGGLVLSFEKERPEYAGDFYANANTKFTIRYSEDNYDEKKREDWLLSKIFKKHTDDQAVYNFERIETNHIKALDKKLDFQSKHFYVESDNVMYGIDSYQNELHNMVRGGLFESTKISHITEHFPSSMDLYQPTSKFTDNNTMSAIILNGYAGDGNYSELEVYKTTEGIDVSYNVKTFSMDEPQKISMQKNNFQLQNLDKGMITSQEISYLLENLRSRFGDGFIELISDDLLEFAKKIDIRKGILKEELDLLSPKLFIDKSFEDIEKMIESDKALYFKIALDEYFALSHQKQEKGQVKVLKPNKSSQSSEN